MTDSLELIKTPDDFCRMCEEARSSGKKVSLVPTMGALHEGHLRLVDTAARHGEIVVATIFVNPTQFGPGEDLDRYPRDLEGDMAKLAGRGANVVFAPEAAAMYPEGASTSVHVSGITEGLCGATRPGHFAGVATIVAKLFNLAGRCTAVFGRKDYQQLQVIRRMAADLNMPVSIVGVPTVREGDGLAMSSRNAYLSAEERSRALAIPTGLATAHDLFASGERSAAKIRVEARAGIEAAFDSVDYVTIADADTLKPLAGRDLIGERALLAVAARVGTTRLIDNTVLGEDEPPQVRP